VALVQDYARYLSDKRSWDEAASSVLPAAEAAEEAPAHALEELLP
jgi:hypothetical protein